MREMAEGGKMGDLGASMRHDDSQNMRDEGKLFDMTRHMGGDDFLKMAEGGKMGDLGVSMRQDDFMNMREDRKSTRLNPVTLRYRMPSSARKQKINRTFCSMFYIQTSNY